MNRAILALSMSIAVITGHINAQEVVLTVEPAVELKIQTREGFRYDIEESETLANFQPSGISVEGSGDTESVFFPVDGKKFFRAAEVATEIRKLIPGLGTYSLATAQVTSENGEIHITGARVTSRDYDHDDFIEIKYAFDITTQQFLPKSFEALTDVGATILRNGKFFPLSDPTEAETVTYQGTAVARDSAVNLSIPGAGGNIVFDTKARQVINYQFSGNKAFEIIILNSQGTETGRSVYSGTSLFQNSFSALAASVNTFRIVPLDGNASTLSFGYNDGNRFGTQTIVRGNAFSTGSVVFDADYRKLRVALEADKQIVLSGTFSNGGTFFLCKPNGEIVDAFTRSNGGSSTNFLSAVPTSGEYFLVFFGSAFQSNSFSGTVSHPLTP